MSEETLPYKTSKEAPSMSASDAWHLVRPSVLQKLYLMAAPDTPHGRDEFENWRLAVRTLDDLYGDGVSAGVPVLEV